MHRLQAWKLGCGPHTTLHLHVSRPHARGKIGGHRSVPETLSKRSSGRCGHLKVSAASAASVNGSGTSISAKVVYHVMSFLEQAPMVALSLFDKVLVWAVDRQRWLAWLLIVYFSITVCGLLYHTGSLDLEAVLGPTERWLLTQGYGDELTAQLLASGESALLWLISMLDWFATIWVTRSLWVAHAANIKHLRSCSPRDSDVATSALPNALFYASLALRAMMFCNIADLGVLSKNFDNLYWGFLLGTFRLALWCSPLPTTATLTAPLLVIDLVSWVLIEFNDSLTICALYTAINVIGLGMLYETQLRKAKDGLEKYKL